MALRDDIQAGCRAAITALAEGETWTWKARTSDPGVEPPTFSAPTTFTARRADRRRASVFDETARRYVLRTSAVLTSAAAIDPQIGDQVVGDGRTWAVQELMTSGIGHQRFMIAFDEPYLGTAGRGGEV
jgi:hypothetical protein